MPPMPTIDVYAALGTVGHTYAQADLAVAGRVALSAGG
jgi:hypothetical protein